MPFGLAWVDMIYMSYVQIWLPQGYKSYAAFLSCFSWPSLPWTWCGQRTRGAEEYDATWSWGEGGTPSRDKYTLPLYPRSRQCCKFCSLHREIQNYCKVVQCWELARLMRVWVSAAYWDKWYTGASVQMDGQPDRYKSYPEPFAHLLTDRQVQMASSKEAPFFEFYPVHLQDYHQSWQAWPKQISGGICPLATLPTTQWPQCPPCSMAILSPNIWPHSLIALPFVTFARCCQLYRRNTPTLL